MVIHALFSSTLRHFWQNCLLSWGYQREGETHYAVSGVLAPTLYRRKKIGYFGATLSRFNRKARKGRKEKNTVLYRAVV